MADYPIRNHLLDIIYSIRPDIGRNHTGNIDEAIAVAQKFETIRILLLNENKEYLTEKAGARVREEISALMQMPEFKTISRRKFRLRPISRASEDNPVFQQKIEFLTISHALSYLVDILDRAIFQNWTLFMLVPTQTQKRLRK